MADMFLECPDANSNQTFRLAETSSLKVYWLVSFARTAISDAKDFNVEHRRSTCVLSEGAMLRTWTRVKWRQDMNRNRLFTERTQPCGVLSNVQGREEAIQSHRSMLRSLREVKNQREIHMRSRDVDVRRVWHLARFLFLWILFSEMRVGVSIYFCAASQISDDGQPDSRRSTPSSRCEKSNLIPMLIYVWSAWCPPQTAVLCEMLLLREAVLWYIVGALFPSYLPGLSGFVHRLGRFF